ncbi:MAG: DUF4040 domain-containing protein [Eubacterium sp.]|nr:DUF4040 domain-containing protein [Eubacterium sp.]
MTGRDLIMIILLILLIVCAICVNLTRRLSNAIVVFMSYSSIMAIIWALLESPDLAITEAAVGAGVTSVLFFLTLRKLSRRELADESAEEEEDASSTENIDDSCVPAADTVQPVSAVSVSGQDTSEADAAGSESETTSENPVSADDAGTAGKEDRP